MNKWTINWLHTRTNHRYERLIHEKNTINYTHNREKCIVFFYVGSFIYCNSDVRPTSFKAFSSAAWSGALRTWTFGGGTGTAGNSFVKWVVGICFGRGGGASRMTIGARSRGGGGWIRT